MKNTGNVFASLVGGMIVGSIVTLLFTPHSGPEMRRHIKDFVDNGSDKVHDKLEKLQDKFEKAACKCD